MKLLAVDVDYREGKNPTEMAIAAGLLFREWDDKNASAVVISEIPQVEDYVPGEFFRRELPCILKLLQDHRLDPDCIVVDGYVFLDGVERPGLGKYLFDALGGRIVVVGVAKKPFRGIPSRFGILRGRSKKPLFVTAAGLEVSKAKQCIAAMHGKFRLPTLLREVDRACRDNRG